MVVEKLVDRDMYVEERNDWGMDTYVGQTKSKPILKNKFTNGSALAPRAPTPQEVFAANVDDNDNRAELLDEAIRNAIEFNQNAIKNSQYDPVSTDFQEIINRLSADKQMEPWFPVNALLETNVVPSMKTIQYVEECGLDDLAKQLTEVRRKNKPNLLSQREFWFRRPESGPKDGVYAGNQKVKGALKNTFNTLRGKNGRAAMESATLATLGSAAVLSVSSTTMFLVAPDDMAITAPTIAICAILSAINASHYAKEAHNEAKRDRAAQQRKKQLGF